MITIPAYAWNYRILGIDNGTNTLGTAILDLDPRTGELVVKFSQTCEASRTAEYFGLITDFHSEKYARLQILKGYMLDLLEEFDPHSMVIESPFSHLNVRTFADLTEAMFTMRQALNEYDEMVPFFKIAPQEGKKAISAKDYKSKDAVRQAVLQLPNLRFDDAVDIDSLDEHCFDAIAVGYSHAMVVFATTRDSVGFPLLHAGGA